MYLLLLNVTFKLTFVCQFIILFNNLFVLNIQDNKYPDFAFEIEINFPFRKHQYVIDEWDCKRKIDQFRNALLFLLGSFKKSPEEMKLSFFLLQNDITIANSRIFEKISVLASSNMNVKKWQKIHGKTINKKLKYNGNNKSGK
jgi:hypothetical protein